MISKLIKRINIYHIISVVVTVGFLVCSVFVFTDAFKLLIGAGKDIFTSVPYFFSQMFGFDSSSVPSVTARHEGSINLPTNLFDFTVQFKDYWYLFFNSSNFASYLVSFGKILLIGVQLLIMIAPVMIIFIKLIINAYFKSINNKYNVDSKPLKAFKRLSAIVYVPIKRYVIFFVAFLKEHKYYLYIWLFIWLYNLNITSIVIDFIAFYLYFSVSFDIASLYTQIVNIFLSLQIVFKYIPWPALLIVALLLIDRWRKKIAIARLEHMENRNKGFINALPISCMVVGTMGKRKTTMLTDMALSLEVIMRDEAYKRIINADLKFPYFPWIVFENALKDEMKAHRVYNLATCRRYVRRIRKLFYITNTEAGYRERERFCSVFGSRYLQPLYCYGYDYNRYGLEYNDGLKVSNLFDVLEEYAQLYLIYIIRSSLIISNYSIRTDFQQIDAGNFPIWDKDFFRKDPRAVDRLSRHAHILDFDMLRLGRKIVVDNINSNSYDFGIVAITEIAKERGNQFDTNELKKRAEEPNQKNDLFNHWLKMIRHPGTVANYPFVKVITDDQREDSLGADTRQLCDIIHIIESSETRLALPLFGYEEMLHDFLINRFLRFYQDYRFKRGDNTLIMYLYKTIASKLAGYYMRIYNRFGYNVLSVETERGTKDSPRAAHKYYISNKKTYSKRFASDCFADYFANKAINCKVGLADMAEYKTERADAEELNKQNSYFITDLNNLGKKKINTGGTL